ncbi:NADP-dependent 3-hydroxy acid dehydrogenase YdfG [Ruaniaceae bacterium KH17]|nr:NADP-dependent 3-hydroxy acid dehydrogenase YdfG [Ruaniaceae bacterium KH17]
MTKRALVSGASTGIGAATVRALIADGWQVLATARRAERLEALAAETGCEWAAADLTVREEVEALVTAAAQAELNAVVHVAGGALGVDRVEDADLDRWRTMYERNVIGTVDLTRRTLPLLRAAGGGDVVFVTSTAGQATYPGGAGYVAAKHAEKQIATTLRLELGGEPIRVIEIAPGMVKTEEFSLNRLGSAEAADDVYAGVEEPLVAEDIAEAIRWSLGMPSHVNVDLMVVRPVAQSSNTAVARQPLRVKG